MSGNRRQRATAAMLSVLLVIIIALIVWEVSYFTRSRSSAATAPPVASPDSTAATASAAPPSLPPRLLPVTIVPRVVSDPFKPALDTEAAPPPPAKKRAEKAERPLRTDAVAPPMPVPPLLPMPRADQPTPAPLTEPPSAPAGPGLRLTGIITDASSSVAIVEGGGEEYRLRAGDFLPNRTRVIAVSSRGLVMRRDNSVCQINVGEVLPWKD